MLVLKNEFDFYDFEDTFIDELEGFSRKAKVIIYDSLCEMMNNGNYTVTDVRDYLKHQVSVMSLDEVIDSYGYDMDLNEDLDDADLIEVVEDYLNNNTYVLGKFEESDETFFVFDFF